jgi:hypothetical protein
MHVCTWLREIPTSVYHQVRLLTQGISGNDRREKQRLLRRLSALRAEFNQLNRELEVMRHQLSLENRGLKTLYDEVKAERDDLQLEIWELEDLVEDLFQLLTSVEAEQVTRESEPFLEISFDTQIPNQPPDHQTGLATPRNQVDLAAVDLSDVKLALVGGHEATRRGVIGELTQQHGLTQWVELPPFSKHSLGRSNIKAKIRDCELIVLITSYMKHKQTDSIMQLKRLESLSGDVLLLNCRGKSGVVREILSYVNQKNCKA